MTDTPRFDVKAMAEELRLWALDLSGQTLDSDLVAARLMDGLRDAALPVPPLAAWGQQVSPFKPDDWIRLELAVRLLRESKVGQPLAACLQRHPEAPAKAFTDFCTREARLLTLELLLKSPFRVEEWCRKLIYAMGGAVLGESPEESFTKLERLDYGGVLNHLKQADQDRAARQKKLKEIEEKRLREQQEAYERAGRE